MSGSSVSFYTLGNMRQAVVDSATSEATGFPKENLIDYNPDTYWKGTSDINQVIDIDLQSAKIVDALVFLVQDYKLHGAPDTYEIFSSPDDIVYTSRGTGNLAEALTQPIIIKDITQQTLRYWRFAVDVAGLPVANISELMLCRKHTIAQAAQWPEQDIERYHNRIIISPGGRQFTQSVNLNKQEVFTRKYRLNLSDMNTLKSIFNDGKGRLFPLILQEGTANADARYVRFESDVLNENQLDFELFEPTVQFSQLPFIASGESY